MSDAIIKRASSLASKRTGETVHVFKLVESETHRWFIASATSSTSLYSMAKTKKGAMHDWRVKVGPPAAWVIHRDAWRKSEAVMEMMTIREENEK